MISDGSRTPQFAGRLYPADAGRLRAAIQSYIEDAAVPRAAGELIGLIVPHGALVAVGPVAGHAYKVLLTAPLTWDLVTLLAPSATLTEGTLACEVAEEYELPTEPMRVAHDAVAALRAGGVPIVADGDDEPVVETHLPFVQAALGDVAVLPLRIGAGAAASALDRHAGRLGLLIAVANLPESLEQSACDAITRLDVGFFASAAVEKPRGLAGLLGSKAARPPATPDTAVLALVLSIARALGTSAGAVVHRNGRLATCALMRR